MCYASKNRIERYDVDRFRTNTSTDIIVEKVSVKISIKQIASFVSMLRNTSRILTEKYTNRIRSDEELMILHRSPNNSLSKKTFNEKSEPDEEVEDTTVTYEATNFKETFDLFSTRLYNVPSQKITRALDIDDEEEKTLMNDVRNKLHSKSDITKDMEEIKEVQTEDEKIGSNTFSFFFHGLSVYFINDYKDNFYPVILLDFSENNYSKETRIDSSFVSQAQLTANFTYYNVHNGYWEPFIEGLNISFEFDKQGNNKIFQIKGKDFININISPDFVNVINYCQKSWEQAQKQLKINSNDRVIDSYANANDIFEEIKVANEEDDSSQSFKQGILEPESMITLKEDDNNLVEVATPYKICNLSGMNIFIQTMFEITSSKIIRDKYILNNGQTTKIAVSYEKQTSKSSEKFTSKINDNIKIQFQGLYLPIEKISLNKLCSKIHKLSENDEEYDFIFYENKVVDMNKVLTLRTQNLLINSTQFVYMVMIKNPDDKSKEKKYKLQPNDSIPFPREDINCKISMKTVEDTEFSNYISAKKLIFNSAIGHTNYIKSGNTFTMIRKEANKTIKDCNDIYLIPPIRIRNGLPVSLHVQLVTQDFEFILDKGAEQHISFYSPDSVIRLAIEIDGYNKEYIPIKFLKKAYETPTKLQSSHNKLSYLTLYTNFSDERAGCYVTFYVKTCFVNA